MAVLFRFLTHYEFALLTARLFCSGILLLAAWEPGHGAPHPFLLVAVCYYTLTALTMAALFNRTERRWVFWNAFLGLDLLVVSGMVYVQGGLHSDLYYYYYLAMTMGSFLHQWRRSLQIVLLANIIYLVTLVFTPGFTSVRELAVRMALFFATSLAFPLLSLIEKLRQDSSSESHRLMQEKEQLVHEMESINREVAAYTFDLHNLAVTDQLTKLHNHTYFHSRIIIEVEKSKQSGKPLSLALLDIDSFKRVNDTYGHLIGDEVLMAISKRMADLLKGTWHIPCRAGGEELAVLMPDTDIEQAYEMAEYLRKEIHKVAVPLPNQDFLKVSVSVGVASFPTMCENHQQLIDHADQAMYVAKSTGKNRTYRYTKVMAEKDHVG